MTVAWECLDVIGGHLMDHGWALLQLGNTAQAEALEERLRLSPDHQLEVRQVREYDGRGVLVLVGRPQQD
jgi:hypothetical protein